MASTLIQTTIPLPANYSTQDVLTLHQRDKQALAEQVVGQTINKGLVWEGKPAVLTIDLQNKQAKVQLAVDGRVKQEKNLLKASVTKMLGLTQAISEFERLYQHHPLLATLIANNKGLRVPITTTPFEAITWAITGQQISVSAAVSIRRRLIQLVAIKHSSGLFCYPNADIIYKLNPNDLRQTGLSQSKAKAFQLLSEQIVKGDLPLDEWQEILPIPVEQITNELSKISGIGPWTINYALLRGFGWLDGSLHGDVAVRRSLQYLLKRDDKLTAEFTANWLDQFRPWRALVAAHLWKLDSNTAY